SRSDLRSLGRVMNVGVVAMVNRIALVGVASSIALFLCGTPAGAQTDTHPIFKDRVFQSVIRGFMELTNGCESLQTRPDFLVKVYEQVPVSSRMRSSAKEVLAQFQC